MVEWICIMTLQQINKSHNNNRICQKVLTFYKPAEVLK